MTGLNQKIGTLISLYVNKSSMFYQQSFTYLHRIKEVYYEKINDR